MWGVRYAQSIIANKGGNAMFGMLFRAVSALLVPLMWPVPATSAIQNSPTGVSTQETSSRPDVAKGLSEAATTYAMRPTNATVDRVWHAIPGLCGYSLDQSASMQATQQADDGRIHLVWQTVPPERRLTELPAEPIYRGPATERSVALMFNVSWGEEYVPSLIETLREQKVPATFFLDGAWVQRHPKLALEVSRSGAAIGSHGSGHPDFRKLSDDAIQRQVQGTNQVIEKALHRRVDLLAPPAGSFDARTVRTAREAGMYTILWSDDSVDWMRPSPDRIVARVVGGAHPGAFILMHPTDSTVKALPQLIERLREAGYQFKTVEAVVTERPVSAPPAVLSGRR